VGPLSDISRNLKALRYNFCSWPEAAGHLEKFLNLSPLSVMSTISFRMLYAVENQDSNKSIFAECIVAFKGTDDGACVLQAIKENEEFLRLNDRFRSIGQMVGHPIGNEDCAIESGTEVWLMLFHAESEQVYLRNFSEPWNPDEST